MIKCFSTDKIYLKEVGFLLESHLRHEPEFQKQLILQEVVKSVFLVS